MASFLELVTTVPQKEPGEMAEELIKSFEGSKHAKTHCELLLKQGLYIPLNRYQINYWNEVIKEIDAH
jgi:hypothetical protein